MNGRVVLSARGLRWCGAALLLGLLLAFLMRPAPVRVDVTAASRGPLQVTVDEEGKTRVRDRFMIAAPVSGRVERIAWHQGDTIEAGTVAARMHPVPLDPRTRAEATARLDQAEAAKRAADAKVEQARAALEQAHRAGERARRLRAAGTMAAQEAELAELAETTQTKELEAAIFAARAADYSVQGARASLLAPGDSTDVLVTSCGPGQAPCIELRAPVRGRVLRVPEESERVVSVGTPLLEIGDPAGLEIVVDVLSTDAVKVRPGAVMLIDDWGGAETLRARVRLVEPAGFTKISALGVEEQRVNVIADFLEPPDALGDNYRVEARIVVWEADDVLRIPSTALFRRNGGWHVFVVHAGRVEHRAIQVGHRSAIEVEVIGGIRPGDLVIIHPSDQIDEGVRVEVLQRTSP